MLGRSPRYPGAIPGGQTWETGVAGTYNPYRAIVEQSKIPGLGPGDIGANPISPIKSG